VSALPAPPCKGGSGEKTVVGAHETKKGSKMDKYIRLVLLAIPKRGEGTEKKNETKTCVAGWEGEGSTGYGNTGRYSSRSRGIKGGRLGALDKYKIQVHSLMREDSPLT